MLPVIFTLCAGFLFAAGFLIWRHDSTIDAIYKVAFLLLAITNIGFAATNSIPVWLMVLDLVCFTFLSFKWKSDDDRNLTIKIVLVAMIVFGVYSTAQIPAELGSRTDLAPAPCRLS